MVRTAGSNASISRVIAVCRARTNAAAEGIGSSDRCGVEAWPPRPRTVASIRSAEAMQRAGPEVDRAARVARADVQRDGPLDASGAVRPVLEQPFVEHGPGAVEALLAGLEHEQDPTGQLVPALDEQARRAEEHGHVRVVATGVHDARRPRTRSRARCPRPAAGRPCRRAGGWSGRARAVDDGHDRGRGPAGHRRQPETGQLVDDDGLGQRQVQPHLRLPMHPSPKVDDVGQDGLGGGQDGGGRSCPCAKCRRSGPRSAGASPRTRRSTGRWPRRSSRRHRSASPRSSRCAPRRRPRPCPRRPGRRRSIPAPSVRNTVARPGAWSAVA